MKNKALLNQDEGGEALAPRAVHRVAWSLVALLLCAALALLVWLCVMNTTHTDYVALTLTGGVENVEYTLSTERMLVEGTVSALKGLEEVEVNVPQYASAPGVYYLTEADLDLPEGVYPAGDFRLVLTVAE